MPSVGEMAPEFQMLNQDGKSVKLSDYRGKKVVLYFYPKDFTPGCELQACNFRDNYAQIAAKNAVILGVSGDDVESHKKFQEAHHLPFTLLYDKDFAYAKAWECYATRTYPDGRTVTGIQRAQWIINENGKITDAQNPVKAPDSLPLALSKLSD